MIINRSTLRVFCIASLSFVMVSAPPVGAAEMRALKPVVEIEEDVYTYDPADNGAGPMWCHGSTCLVRIGDDVFASGLETVKDARPLNNCRWMLFHRDEDRWKKVCFDLSGRTREPCPLAGFADGRLFLSANPTLSPDPNAYSGPARPEILQFAFSSPSGIPPAPCGRCCLSGPANQNLLSIPTEASQPTDPITS
ncbi:MAG: hypothetical protein ACYS0H_14780 [Planctomycetota bacterium]|jgi:hypothetical protein